MEKLPPISTSRYKQAEREELIIRCFEKSGDLSLLQLQERQEKGSKAGTAVAVQSTGVWNVLDSDAVGVGPLVETVIQRSPILYIRNGSVDMYVEAFYSLLRNPIDNVNFYLKNLRYYCTFKFLLQYVSHIYIAYYPLFSREG